jgi:hypothetical protein
MFYKVENEIGYLKLRDTLFLVVKTLIINALRGAGGICIAFKTA